MNISHIFFDLHGTLVDSRRMGRCYAAQLGIVMAERYGGQPQMWEQANLSITADWDSYHADLNFDENFEDMWESYIRTTRALFRLTGTPEPPLSELTALSRELPGLATRCCDALFPESRAVIAALHATGYTLGITSHSLVTQARGSLTGGGMLHYFAGPLIGPDVTGTFAKNRRFFSVAAQQAGVDTGRCLVVDDDARHIPGAQAAGMHAVYLSRQPPPPDTSADHVLAGDLTGLLAYLGVGA